MDLYKLIEELNGKNKLSLRKEIKEIKVLTNNEEEIKSLFTVNILINIINEKLIVIQKNKDLDDNSYANKAFRKALVNFISSPLIINHIFKKDDFLNKYIDEDNLKTLMKNIAGKENLLMSLNTADVIVLKNLLLNEYNKDPLFTRKIMEDYDFHLGFMDKSMSGEDYFLNRLEEELGKISKEIEKQKINNTYYGPAELTSAINTLATDYFVEILLEMKNSNISDRSEMKIIFLTRKLLEWKNEKRQDDLYEKINEREIESGEVEVNRKRNKI